VHNSYHTFPDGSWYPANGLIVRQGDGLLLIDTAWGAAQTATLLKEIAQQIKLPVRSAIITHWHDDRAAGVGVLERAGVKVRADQKTCRLLRQKGRPVPDAPLKGLDQPGDAVAVGSVEVLFPGPAHTPDNVMVWIPSQKVLFGDCMVREMAAKDLGNTADGDGAAWPQAIRRAQARYPQAQIVVPGHGAPGGRELLAHTLSLCGQ
jgi:metallo-beta-lactamase class B VIM